MKTLLSTPNAVLHADAKIVRTIKNMTVLEREPIIIEGLRQTRILKATTSFASDVYDQETLDGVLDVLIAAEAKDREARVAQDLSWGRDDEPAPIPVFTDEGQIVAQTIPSSVRQQLDQLAADARGFTQDVATALKSTGQGKVQKAEKRSPTDIVIKRILKVER